MPKNILILLSMIISISSIHYTVYAAQNIEEINVERERIGAEIKLVHEEINRLGKILESTQISEEEKKKAQEALYRAGADLDRLDLELKKNIEAFSTYHGRQVGNFIDFIDLMNTQKSRKTNDMTKKLE